jgi:farnesyl-diphosphate farnesyltransferase
MMAEIPPSLLLLLRDTSRSFYLTLRVLPAPVRPQIGLAYLLARATDTVADTDLISVSQRLDALGAMRRRILDPAARPLDLTSFVSASSRTASLGEQRLLARIEEAVAVLHGFSGADQARIASVIDIITGGQELDLQRFGGATANSIVALRSGEELDDYTFRVAGCVGRFWTEMCSAHLFGEGAWDEAAQLRRGVEFGKGLQLVNILRDLPRDLRQGRCYLPSEELAEVGLLPRDLLETRNGTRLRPIYERYLDRSQAFLDSGWAYTLGIPGKARRLRLGCALPILIGVRTLGLLRQSSPLAAAAPVKVTRPWLRGAAGRAFLACWGLQDWQRLYGWAKG